MAQVESAAREGKLSPGAVTNIDAWLTEPRYAEYAPLVAEHIGQAKWKELDDAFWTVIPFGTGGRRGRMYPIGSNAINDRTIGESAQGLADYVKDHAAERMGTGSEPKPVFPARSVSGEVPVPIPLSCAIAYDTRHRSREFAELCAEVMAAAEFKVWFLDGYRSTPELSFAVRYKQCACGIIVTASHNPPSDNAVKAYWSTGGQILPPHDRGVIERVMTTTDIRRLPFEAGVASGQIEYCQEDVDRAFLAAVERQSRPGPRDIKIIYSPLHGVGASAVLPALAAAGFKDVELFGPHAVPSGDFPNVPGHVSNPENPRVFDMIVERAKETGAELILATDPDCDRVGCSAPKTTQPGAPWDILTGNQIAAVLADYLLEIGRRDGTLTAEHYVVKTLVTTELMRRIADAHGVQTVGDLQVGFKWIGGVMDERDPKRFILGAEESYGFLIGDHCRDKDAAVASMILAELTARAKAEGLSLHEKLDAPCFRKYGCHGEQTVSVQMPGAGRHGPDESPDGPIPQCPAGNPSGHEGRPSARLPVANRHAHGRQARAAGRLARRHRHPRPRSRRQLRRRSPLGHGAEGEVLHVRLRPARGKPGPRRHEGSPSRAAGGDAEGPGGVFGGVETAAAQD